MFNYLFPFSFPIPSSFLNLLIVLIRRNKENMFMSSSILCIIYVHPYFFIFFSFCCYSYLFPHVDISNAGNAGNYTKLKKYAIFLNTLVHTFKIDVKIRTVSS